MKAPKGKSGFVLPSLVLVTIVLLILATTLLSSGTTSLRVATFDQQADQALYAAEAGLVRAAEEFAKEGAIPQPFEDDLDAAGSHYRVTAYENTSVSDVPIPVGISIPAGTVYLYSEGFSENGTCRKTGALFRSGLQAFKVGALGNQVTVNNSSFDAYDSGDGDYGPDTVQNDLPLLASNTNNADLGFTFNFTNANVAGDVFVGPGGDPEAQISSTTSTLGDTTAMAEAIDLEEIEVPEEEEEGDVEFPSVGNFQLKDVDDDGVFHFDDGTGLKFSVDPENFDENDRTAHINAPGLTVISGGNGTDSYIQIGVPGQPGHFIVVTEQAEEATHNDNTQALYNPDPVENPQLSSLLFLGQTSFSPAAPASVVNPTELKEGHYDSVTVKDGFPASLEKDGVYVIKNLNISGNAKLSLPADGVNATIYVTESLTVDGQNALVNETLKAPKMKIFYTGQNAVSLSGGSKSYFTLVAPKSDVRLDSAVSGVRTQFFGALVGDQVTINNAAFHFDTATSGIGTGTQGTALSLIHRHRL